MAEGEQRALPRAGENELRTLIEKARVARDEAAQGRAGRLTGVDDAAIARALEKAWDAGILRAIEKAQRAQQRRVFSVFGR